MSTPIHGAGTDLRTAVVVGNPRPGSRTLAAANLVLRELTGRRADLVVDLADLGGELLDPRAEHVDRLVTDVAESDLVVVASPTYKATYTGLLKVFLDRFGARRPGSERPDSDAATAAGRSKPDPEARAAGQLDGLVVPLMLGAGPGHQLAVEHALRPLLSELGAVVPWPGLYVLDSLHDDPAAYADWLDRARPVLAALHPSDTSPQRRTA